MNLLCKILISLSLLYPGVILLYYSYADAGNYHQIVPNWAHNTEKNQLLRNRTIENQPILRQKYFYNKKNLIYLNRHGEALHKISVDSKTLIAPDNHYYIVYPQLGMKIDLFNSQGEKQWSLETYAIPKITPFRKNTILISSDHNTLSIYDFNRNLILAPSYLGSLITDYSICENNDSLIIGTIEGNLYHYNHQAKQIFKKNFENSRYNYLKSVACSPSGNYILALSGLYPEWLSLVNADGEVVWQLNTEQDRRTKTDLFFDENNNFVLDAKKNSISVFSLERGEKVTDINPEPKIGQIKKTVFSSISGWMLLGINGENSNEIQLINNQFKTIWKSHLIGEYLTHAELIETDSQIFFILYTVSSVYNYQLIL